MGEHRLTTAAVYHEGTHTEKKNKTELSRLLGGELVHASGKWEWFTTGP